MTLRIISSVIVLLSIILLPYWVYLPVLFSAVVLLPFYWEGIVFALLIDVLYGEGIRLQPSLLTIVVILSLIILMPLKERLRLHA